MAKRHIAIDGKTVGASKDGEGERHHLVRIDEARV